MKRYAFILGKNPILSSAEIVSVLKARGISFNLQDRGREFLVMDLSERVSVGDLGGSIKLGEVLSSFPGKSIPDDALKEAASLIPPKSLFGVSAYGMGWKDSASMLKRFRGKQCKFMNIPRGRGALTHVEVIKRRLIEDSVEFLTLSGSRTHLAKTLGVHNPFEFQKRDMDRPFKRPMLSIPPRLARIMVNLAGQKPGGVLLDPFCGIGTVLQEAALMDFTVWGIDTDKKVIPWARRNIKWLFREYGLTQPGFEERMQNGDARKLLELFPANSLDAIVTEPDLGPPLKRMPDLNRARRIIRKLTPLYERFIRGSAGILRPGGRLVTISPTFDVGIRKRMVRLNMEALAKGTGLELINPLGGSGIDYDLPFIDREERHRTIREITVMELSQ